MPKHWPRMRPYRKRGRPRKYPPKGLSLNKQMLQDLKHHLSTDAQGVLAFMEEGNQPLANEKRLKLKSNLLKYREEIEKTALHLGTKEIRAVRAFLDSLEAIAHSESFWLDREVATAFYEASEKLEAILQAA
jgi:hypothetical protein